MAKRKSKVAPAPVKAEPQVTTSQVAAAQVVREDLGEKLFNSFLGAIQQGPGIGGGFNDLGFPGNQGSPYTEQIENVTTIFRNLRWYLISNMRQVLSQAYVELGLVATICDVPVDDALRGGVTMKSKQLDESQLQQLSASVERDGDLITLGQGAKWNRLFGGAGIVVIDDTDPETPFDINLVTEHSRLQFRAVDMWELFWTKQNVENYDFTLQEHDDFEFYDYYGMRLHKSRVFIMKGLEAPSFIRPRLRGWGFSVIEILVRSINQYLKGTDLAFEVLDEFKVDVYKIKGYNQALANPDAFEKIKKRLAIANFTKNYQNALTMDVDDEWDHKQLSFTGISEAMLQIRMQVAADMRMPLTKLFGISAAGFNSGEDDIEVYNAMVESTVREKLKPIAISIIELKCQKLFGFVPDDLELEFSPLRYMSSEQEEGVKTAEHTRLLSSYQAGAITLEEFRNGCNKAGIFKITLDSASGDLLAAFKEDTTDEDEITETPDAEKSPKKAAMNPPKAKDPKSQKAGGSHQGPRPAPDLKPLRNTLQIMPQPFTRKDKALRVLNSAVFDRKSYEADGGDGWINPKRELFFDRDKALQPALWDKAVQASQKAYGAEKWQFVVWMYKKLGGAFGVQNTKKKRA